MGYLKIISAILIWSSLGIFVRKINLPAEVIIFYTAAVAGLCQLILLSMAGSRKEALKTFKWDRSIFLLLLIPVCFLANTFLFYFSFAHTTIANAVITHYTAPIFVAVMAPVFLKERIHIVTWLAILLSSAGLWFMLGGISVTDSEWNGILAGISSGLTYALLILLIRGVASKYSELLIVIVQNVIICLLLLPFVLKAYPAAGALPYLVIMGIVHSTIAPLLYVQGLKSVKANEAAILGYFEPVGAIILAWIFLHENLYANALPGGVLILVSGIMILRKREK
jgi:drug/metabolite transporter (DMT)-like permease